MDDDELIATFEDTSLPHLSHEDHVRLVFLFAQRHGPERAYERVRAGLIAYTVARGSFAQFHETRTWAWASLVAKDAAGFAGDFPAFLAQHPRFVRRDLLAEFYSDEVLASSEARETVIVVPLD